MSAIEYWLWLSTSAKLSPRAKAVLLKHYGGPEAMYEAPRGEITRLLGRRAEGAEDLEKRDLSSALRTIDRCRMQNVEVVSTDDPRYPVRLKNIYAPPSVIYVKGKLPKIDEEPAIAVIGTRNASPYGIKMGRKLGYEIAKCGGVVISGLTKGIDAAGAEGALIADGMCVGVLGVPHELARGKMAEELAVRGALVSEYPPGAGVHRQFFRARNRIAAGLSVGVIVVEAPFKSGTKLFVDEAVEQGKEIFAVPGNADCENCAGTNAMLKDGAKPVTEGWDVMSEFAKLYPDKVKKSTERIPGTCIKPEQTEPVKTEKTHKNTKKVIDKPDSAEYIDLKKQLESLTGSQLSIVSAMDREAMQVDEIIERTCLSPAKVLADLTLLQLKGCVSQQSGKRFTLNIERSEDS